MAFIGGVDVTGQANPEDGYGHGVVIQDPVPPHTPEPTTLCRQARVIMRSLSLIKNIYCSPPFAQLPAAVIPSRILLVHTFVNYSLYLSNPKQTLVLNTDMIFTSHLENKHLSSQHGHRVKVPVTDVGGMVVWQLGGPRRSRGPRRRRRWRWRRMGDVFSDCRGDRFRLRLGNGGGGGGEDGR